jgi:hypothetical protein
MQIKMTRRLSFHPQNQKITNTGEGTEKKDPLHVADGSVN